MNYINRQPIIEHNEATNFFNLLTEKMFMLHSILSRNSYVKNTTLKLQKIIDDAQNESLVFIMGQDGVGKSTLINALLGRNLFNTELSEATKANIFIRYGTNEYIKIHFLDGTVKHFDIPKLHLLTTSNLASAQIIREFVDYIEVYIRNDFLLDMTLIDSKGIDLSNERTAFIPDALLERIDAAVWIVKTGNSLTNREQVLLKKLNTKRVKPYFILNAKESYQGSISQFKQQQLELYGENISKMIEASAKLAIEASKTNNVQSLIDSNFTEVMQMMREIAQSKHIKSFHILDRFIQWLQRLQIDFTLLTLKEPYISAVTTLKQQSTNMEFDFTRHERNLTILQSYEEEYRHVSSAFNGIETLYQLLQVLAVELYLRDEEVEAFEEQAMYYHEAIREYRKMHSEYASEFLLFEKQHKRAHQKEISDELFKFHKQNNQLQMLIESLNLKQMILQQKYQEIKNFELSILQALPFIQNHLQSLMELKLVAIKDQVNELFGQLEHESLVINSHKNKLQEFECLASAQQYIQDEIYPFIVHQTSILIDEQQQSFENSVQKLKKIELSQKQLIDKVSQQDQSQNVSLHENFEQKYELFKCILRPENVVSEFPSVPQKLMVQYILSN